MPGLRLTICAVSTKSAQRHSVQLEKGEGYRRRRCPARAQTAQAGERPPQEDVR
jgi:hypothetical protein